MRELKFDKPWILFFLFILIPFIIGILIKYQRRIKSFKYLTYYLSQKEFLIRFTLMHCGYTIFLCCTIIALAGPRWGSRLVPESRRGLDTILAFDLSKSMDVADIDSQTRLSRALEIAQSLVAGTSGRFGTAIAKGRGILALPLTFDTESLLAFLAVLSTSSVTGHGTNLESLIDAASSGFYDAFPTRRLVVLFSDGENLVGSPLLACERAARAGITIVAIALGTEEGSPVPGEAVISGLQIPLLQDIAHRTGGTVINGNTKDAELILMNYLVTNTPTVQLLHKEDQPQWHIFVVAGLAALILAQCAGRKRRGALTALMVFFCSCSNVTGIIAVVEGNFYYGRGQYTRAITAYMKALKSEKTLPYAEFGLGAAYYALDEEALAAKRFVASAQATNNRALQHRIHYNTGIIHFEQNNFEAAVKEFRLALELDGSTLDAKRNLELSLSALAQHRTKPKVQTKSDSTHKAAQTVLFDYLREKERNHWKSQEWVEPDAYSGADY
ncbi:MAG: tetratricopeptide repeat protein [Spirochaetaceae bacterium]|jgi:Ca-activated chloride channel family protein|nr:tetratricopeptide repeat protein [Spirochaetaceae bacterium]